MMKKKKSVRVQGWVLAGLLGCLHLASCKDLFQFSPNEVRLEENEKDLNARNILRIREQAPKDTFRFIVIGDSQRFYNELEDFVSAANKRNDISFVVLNGDISDFGLNKEFQWVNRSLKKLRMPYIGVIGNHDMLANGRLVFGQMFGPENFTFEYGSNKFICLNTNSLECGYNGTIPNMSWLQQQLDGLSGYRNAFVFSHIPPSDGGFDPKLAPLYSEKLLASGKVRLSAHGHVHTYSHVNKEEGGVQYLNVGTIHKRSYGLVTVANETVQIEEVFY